MYTPHDFRNIMPEIPRFITIADLRKEMISYCARLIETGSDLDLVRAMHRHVLDEQQPIIAAAEADSQAKTQSLLQLLDTYIPGWSYDEHEAYILDAA